MQLFLNIVLARSALILSILLTIILLLRLGRKIRPETRMGRMLAPLFARLAPLDKWLRSIHIPLGVALVVTGLVHGLLSSESVLSVNLGTVTLVLSVLLGLSFMFRKALKKRGWMVWHRGLTALFVGALVLHIVNVGGFIPNLAETAFFSDNATQLASIQSAQDPNQVSLDTNAAPSASSDNASAGSASASGATSAPASAAAQTGDTEAQGTASAWLSGLLGGGSSSESTQATASSAASTAAPDTAAPAAAPAAASDTAPSTAASSATASDISPSTTVSPATTPASETPVATPTATPTATPVATPAATPAAAGKYKDGVYTASARGYGPDLTVQVTLANDLITDIQIVSHNERNARYYARPMQIVPQEIIDTQSTDVDIVSGATRTSNGIMNAVDAALAQAAN